MLRFIVGAFVVLHGLVHLFYFGQARRLFDLQAEMTWPDGSWAFSRLLGDGAARGLASVACVLAAIGLVGGGAGILLGQAWWRPVIAAAAAFAAVVFVLFWNGRMQRLDYQGGIGILIDIAILASVLVFRWPDFEF